MHLTEGEIRAFDDQQLEPAAARRVEAHLASCPECRARLQAAHDTAQRIHARLNGPEAPAACPSPAVARRKLAVRLQPDYKPMERQPMLKKLITKISRPAWAGIALIAVLAVALAFPPVRAAANSFLQLFRVEQVRLLPVNMEALSSEMQASQNLEALFTENVQVEQQGERQEVATFDEAAALAPFALRKLPVADQPARYLVEPASSLTFKVDLELARGALREMGREDIVLPDSLDGAVIQVDGPVAVTTRVGDCAVPSERQDPDMPAEQRMAESPNCTTLTQAPSPSVSAPPELDLAQMGQLYLQVLGMTEEEAQIYASSVDWATTLVMPVPQNGSGEYEEVVVDGVRGVFVGFPYRYDQTYALMWVKDGILYMLHGSGDKAAALELATSIQ